MVNPKTLRLLLGDQLNINHSWFTNNEEHVTYVLMEIRSETDYAYHHIQKILAIFSAMRAFAELLSEKNHAVIYIKLGEISNQQSFQKNCYQLIQDHQFEKFEYQLPDEFRVDKHLKHLVQNLEIPYQIYDTEHFFTSRNEIEEVFGGKKIVMENFYRYMRKKHHILMNLNDSPINQKWNFDENNRKKIPKNHKVSSPLLFNHNVNSLYLEIQEFKLKTIGTVDPANFIWPINRKQALELLEYFIKNCLHLFGTFQDAMQLNEFSLYHSRLSFALNIKLVSPQEVIDKTLKYYENKEKISYNQIEGFVRQIIGWREYMRNFYWSEMPSFKSNNFFKHKNKLPEWYWTGDTKMACLRHTIKQSLKFAYAHHIQRLMVTGNFALLSQTDPDEIDMWYLSIYIDAFEWVEITNTRGMSQFADGGKIATKPYISSGNYIHKMSNYCENCHYNYKLKSGAQSCPFNSLYWHFLDTHESLLISNQRLKMAYNIWRNFDPYDKNLILKTAKNFLDNIEIL